jgi:hypothetical protein
MSADPDHKFDSNVAADWRFEQEIKIDNGFYLTYLENRVK